MKSAVLILIFCAVAFGNEYSAEASYDDEDGSNNIQTQGLFLGMTAKSVVRKLLEQLPCGFPEAGIPPLAPYTNELLALDLNASLVEAIGKVWDFSFDGLDKMEIKKMKVSYVFRKISFEFNFPLLTVESPKYESDVILDMMKSLGLKISYKSVGNLKFALKNIRFGAKFNYRAPLVFGSFKIFNFRVTRLSLDSVDSSIGGVAGNGEWNQYLNDKLEEDLPELVQNMREDIEDKLNELIVPQINKELHGRKILNSISFKKPKKCVPPTL